MKCACSCVLVMKVAREDGKADTILAPECVSIGDGASCMFRRLEIAGITTKLFGVLVAVLKDTGRLFSNAERLFRLGL